MSVTSTLLLRGLARGKARFACAALGVAAAAGAVVFVFSLAASNAAQAPALARKAAEPWAAWRFEGMPGAPSGPGAENPRAKSAKSAKEVSHAESAEKKPHAESAESGGRARAPRAPGSPAGGVAERSEAEGAIRLSSFGIRHSPDLSLDLVSLTLDYRPGGRVLQGPPMRAIVAAAPAENPWGCTRLAEGRWTDDAAADAEVVCTRGTLQRFGRGEPPPLGEKLKFVGMQGTMTATLVGYLDDAKLPPGWPSVFANRAAFGALSAERHGTLSLWSHGRMVGSSNGRIAGSSDHTTIRPSDHTTIGSSDLLTPESEMVVNAFKGDENRRMDYARPLLLVAAVLTALSLLVNSLLLAVEANRRTLALLRTVGLSRGGVARLVAAESLLAVAAGWALGCAFALGALALYVRADPVAFPTGPAVAWRSLGATAAIGAAVALLAVLFALRPALAVRPLDALAERPRRRRHGMAVAFALGFGAFVAVEVWGASLMRGFVPSPEWPDAIVSLLPAGVDPCDRPKVDGLPGVRRISELYPLQLAFEPEIEMKMPGGRGGPGGGRRMLRNALFLGAEWLPRFRFLEGTWEEADAALRDPARHACVIAEMVSRAHNLHKGDTLRVASGGRGPKRVYELEVAGVVDLNWHMVTSRGLVRGLNGSPVMTDGPAFVSLETANWLDPRPFLASVNLTHLWVEYEPAFLAEKGVFPAGREVEREIVAALGDPVEATVRLHARDEIADGTLAHGSDLIGQAARVPFVFLAILSIGFVAMLVADADTARRELAVLRAVGATRSQLAWRLARGALRTALAGIAVGLPGGALCGWMVSRSTGSMWPGFPHHFAAPWRVLAEGAAGSLVFVLLVAIPASLLLVARARRAGEGR
jgi:hypothetical protein